MAPTAGEPDLALRIEQRDETLFGHVLAQLTRDDRRSLLALHAACRRVHGSFGYLEIGSYLGGSLQALVCDPACERIVSIDPRPAAPPDVRGRMGYADNSTERMLENLRAIPGAAVDKIQAVEASTEDLDPADAPFAPQLCFVDGEHTHEAALRDARYCAAAVAGNGAVAFHDAHIVYKGIAAFVAELEAAGVEHTPYLLPTSVFVVELGPPRLRDDDLVREALAGNWRGYLYSLSSDERYRDFFVRPPFPLVRRLRARLRRSRTES